MEGLEGSLRSQVTGWNTCRGTIDAARKCKLVRKTQVGRSAPHLSYEYPHCRKLRVGWPLIVFSKLLYPSFPLAHK